jgi:hypothetical protein
MITTPSPTYWRQAPRTLVLILVLVCISRIPLLPLGFGSDGDAWRAARAGYVLWTTGQYEVSRFPGFPLHEIVLAPVVATRSPLLSNGLTLLVTIGMLLVWARLVTLHGRFPLLLTIALFFSPMVWSNSASSTDHIWSLACILVTLQLTLMRRFLAAGVLLGLAAGFRPAGIIAVIPIVVLVLYTSGSWRQVITVVSCSAVTAVLAFTPVIATYGIRGWLAAMKMQLAAVGLPFTDQILLFAYRSVYAVGLVPAIVLVLLFVYNRHALHAAFARRDAFVIASLAGIVAFALLFMAFPYDRAYLMPALPFLFLLSDRIATKRWMVALTVAIISYAFINIDVIQHHDTRGTPGMNIRPGIVIQDWLDRKELLAERESLPRQVFPQNSIVMTGMEDSFTFLNPSLEPDRILPGIALRETVSRSRAHPDLFFVPLLHADELSRLQEEGYTIFCRGEVRAYIESIARYDLSRNHVTILPSWGRQ